MSLFLLFRSWFETVTAPSLRRPVATLDDGPRYLVTVQPWGFSVAIAAATEPLAVISEHAIRATISPASVYSVTVTQ